MNANAAFFALMGRIFDDHAVERLMDLTTGTVSPYVDLSYAGIISFVSTTSEAARHFGYSREYFSRLFKKYSGTVYGLRQ